MKLTRVDYKIPGWVSFKIESGTNKNDRNITREDLIKSIKNRIKDIKLEHGDKDE